MALLRYGDGRFCEIRPAPRLGHGSKIGSFCILICRSSWAGPRVRHCSPGKHSLEKARRKFEKGAQINGRETVPRRNSNSW